MRSGQAVQGGGDRELVATGVGNEAVQRGRYIHLVLVGCHLCIAGGSHEDIGFGTAQEEASTEPLRGHDRGEGSVDPSACGQEVVLLTELESSTSVACDVHRSIEEGGSSHHDPIID